MQTHRESELRDVYPPAVNYTPLYYLIMAPRSTRRPPALRRSRRCLRPRRHGGHSSAPVTTNITGTVLVRLVNAGLRMHVPSIVGAQTGAAGGLLTDRRDRQRAAGCAARAKRSVHARGQDHRRDDQRGERPGCHVRSAIFDRRIEPLGQCDRARRRHAAYISVNNAALPTTGAFSAASTTVTATSETYYCAAGQTLAVLDAGKGVLPTTRTQMARY